MQGFEGVLRGSSNPHQNHSQIPLLDFLKSDTRRTPVDFFSVPPSNHRGVAMRISLCAVLTCGLISPALAGDLSPLEELGKRIFFDTNLSTPPGQSCASCHSPETGFTGPDSSVNRKSAVYEGAAKGQFGN